MPLTNNLGFSELIDEAAVITGRTSAQRKLTLTSYAAATIRECQVGEFFARDLTEDTITADSENPFLWTKPRYLRRLRTVKYSDGVFPKFLLPGKVQRDINALYYAGPTYYAFKGIDIGSTMDVAYYSYLSRLRFYDDTTGNERPAIFDYVENTWTYWDGAAYVPNLATTELDDAAEAKVINWLIEDWYDTILQGTLAKQFSLLKDARAGTAFATYNSLRLDIKKGEQNESFNQ